MTLLFLIALLSADYPGFQPAPGGIGAENLPLSVRSLGMGGASAGVEDGEALCFTNPAAGAWARSTGFTWAFSCREGDDPARDGRCSFPVVSALFPLPFGTVLSAGIAERSSLTASDETGIDGYRGTFEWSGGLSDAWAGMSARASSWLSFAAGARGTFGNMRSEVILQPPSSGPEIPVNTIYIDEALFRPCWGFSFSAFIRTGVVDFGAGIVTDRTGSLDVERDFAGSGSSTEGGLYTIPGELNLGVSARPAPWLLLAADLHRRKTLNILDSTVGEGGIASFGAEVTLGGRFAVRSGYSSMDGLWRPGSGRISIGGGYRFSGDRAGVDLAVTREVWSDSSETGVFASLWASEIW